jgi:glycosyltransferase involved in cell wall biosynthesis
MRVAYIANSSVPSRTANSINVVKMSAAMASLGNDVSLIVPNRPPIESAVDLFDFYGITSKFDVRVLPWWPIKGRSLVYFFAAARVARGLGADLAYTRVVSAAYVASLNGLPVLLELHSPPDGLGRKLLHRLSKASRLRRVICISNSLADYIQDEYPCLRSRIIVAHDGADDPGVGEQRRFEGRNYKIRAGYVGHLYPGKGMEIVSELARRCPWANFHVVGGMARDIDEWRKALKAMDNVELHGFVPPREVPGYLRAMDVLLAPYQRSVSPYGWGADIAPWMSPLKLFEYMAVGGAIVCSDLAPLREVMEHEVNALMCDPTSIDSWVKALERLTEDLSLRSTLSKSARAQFEAHHSWSARADHVLSGLS